MNLGSGDRIQLFCLVVSLPIGPSRTTGTVRDKDCGGWLPRVKLKIKDENEPSGCGTQPNAETSRAPAVGHNGEREYLKALYKPTTRR